MRNTVESGIITVDQTILVAEQGQSDLYIRI